ncbi:Uncharacterised protein [Collinsella aerofaciens]|uniref:Uncharacterized protein n=1 Tax=Collinsella aerofaciens TaxID=74426 RepID=A0A6N2YCS9_9ACTN
MRRSLPRLALTAALLASVLTGAPAYAAAANPSQVTGPSECDRMGFLVGIMFGRS